MLTKNFNIHVYNFKIINLLWSQYIKDKVLNFEKKIRDSKLLELQESKDNLLTNLLELNANTELLNEDELVALNFQKLEITDKILDIEEGILFYNKTYDNFCKSVPLSKDIDLLFKYINIFKNIDYRIEFLTIINLSTSTFNNSILNISDTVNQRNNLINLISYQKHPIHFLHFLESLKQICKDYLFISKKKKKRRRAKRIFRKIKLLRRLRRFLFFKKKKKFIISVTFNFTKIFKIFFSFKDKLLLKKIPLSHRVILKSNVEFFYKLHKDTKRNLTEASYTTNFNTLFTKDKFRVYLRNFHQKPFWKLRKARIAHWSLFFNKTLRKQRYKVFINRFIKSYQKLSYNYSFFFNFFFKTHISWTRFSKLESFFKLLIVDRYCNILKLPFFFKNMFQWTAVKKKNYIMRKKVGRWSFLNYKRSQTPWLQNKKNSPKNIRNLQPNKFLLMSISNWDTATNTVYLSKQIEPFTFPTKDNFKVNWQIKLHMYRYKSNKVCFLLLIIYVPLIDYSL